jgi:hypothetical protein
MSVSLLSVLGTPREYLQTAVDDLESFVWVLLWASLEKLDEISSLSAIERGFFDIIHSNNIDKLTGRAVFPLHLFQNRGSPSPGFAVFNNLIQKWLDMSLQFSKDISLEKGHPLPKVYYQRLYENYLKVGFDAVQTMPEDWSYAYAKSPVP